MMTPEMKVLEAAIFLPRRPGRLKAIREAWAVLCKSMEPEEPEPSWWERLLRRQAD